MLSKLIYRFDVTTIIKILVFYLWIQETQSKDSDVITEDQEQLKPLWEGITKLEHHNKLQSSRDKDILVPAHSKQTNGAVERACLQTHEIQSCGPLIVVKGVLKTCSAEKNQPIYQILLTSLNIYMQKNEIRLISSFILYKNQSEMDQGP